MRGFLTSVLVVEEQWHEGHLCDSTDKSENFCGAWIRVENTFMGPKFEAWEASKVGEKKVLRSSFNGCL